MNLQTQKSFVNKFLVLFAVVGFVFLTIIGATNANGGVKADFDGDGKSDISVFRRSDGLWHIAKSSGGYSSIRWGSSTDFPTPGDYDGDGKTDVAVFRFAGYSAIPNPCFFYVLKSSDNNFFAKQWGTSSYIIFDYPLINGDFDGDRVTDFSVYEGQDYIPATVRFKTLRSADNTASVTSWGYNIDRQTLGDYDGDGKTDIAVFRSGVWFIKRSSDEAVVNYFFGNPSDIPLTMPNSNVYY